MRIAVISDVHGRLPALRAALRAIDDAGVDEIWCLGDVCDTLGLTSHADQLASVHLVEERCAVRIAGNHEFWALRDGTLPDTIRRVVAGWTPLMTRHGVRAVHASLRDPLMEFVNSTEVAGANLELLDAGICVFGHTHIATLAGIAAEDVRLVFGRVSPGVTVGLDRFSRTMLNPGAIADEDRATWMSLDLAANTVTWHRVRCPASAA